MPNTSLQLLLRGVNRVLKNINTINPEFAKHIDWSSLLTTIAENLHAVSHFKLQFSVLQYAMNFGTISKESLKRLTKWKASYFTHPASHYPVRVEKSVLVCCYTSVSQIGPNSTSMAVE